MTELVLPDADQLAAQLAFGLAFGVFVSWTTRLSASFVSLFLFATFVFSTGSNLVYTAMVQGEVRDEVLAIALLRGAFILGAAGAIRLAHRAQP